MMKQISTMLSQLAVAASALTLSTPAFAAIKRWQLNMTEGVTETSKQVYDLHMIVLWICVVIGIRIND